MRPEYTPRGTRGRFMLPALVAPVAPARADLAAARRLVLVTATDRAHVATALATGFRSAEGDAVEAARRAGLPEPAHTPEVDALLAVRSHARSTLDALGATIPAARRADQLALAIHLQQRLVALPDADRVPVAVAVVRGLLDDAPDRCVDLDRAVRVAVDAHAHTVTDAHHQAARELIALAETARAEP